MKQLKLVPTSHDCAYVITEFIKLRLNNKSIEQFFEGKQYTQSTKKAYMYPFQEKEFNLFNESINGIKYLKQNSYDFLKSKYDKGFVLGDDRNNICLKNVWLVGYLNENYSKKNKIEILLNAGFAGTKNASNVIMYVGKSTGLYFNLLSTNGIPTNKFNDFYSNDMSLLKDRITNAVKGVKVNL